MSDFEFHLNSIDAELTLLRTERDALAAEVERLKASGTCVLPELSEDEKHRLAKTIHGYSTGAPEHAYRLVDYLHNQFRRILSSRPASAERPAAGDWEVEFDRQFEEFELESNRAHQCLVRKYGPPDKTDDFIPVRSDHIKSFIRDHVLAKPAEDDHVPDVGKMVDVPIKLTPDEMGQLAEFIESARRDGIAANGALTSRCVAVIVVSRINEFLEARPVQAEREPSTDQDVPVDVLERCAIAAANSWYTMNDSYDWDEEADEPLRECWRRCARKMIRTYEAAKGEGKPKNLAYVRMADGVHHETLEIGLGWLFGDFAADGTLLGVEITDGKKLMEAIKAGESCPATSPETGAVGDEELVQECRNAFHHHGPRVKENGTRPWKRLSGDSKADWRRAALAVRDMLRSREVAPLQARIAELEAKPTPAVEGLPGDEAIIKAMSDYFVSYIEGWTARERLWTGMLEIVAAPFRAAIAQRDAEIERLRNVLRGGIEIIDYGVTERTPAVVREVLYKGILPS